MAVVSVVVVHVYYTLHGVFGLFLIAQKLLLKLLCTHQKSFSFLYYIRGGFYVCMDLLGTRDGNKFIFLKVKFFIFQINLNFK